MADVYVEPLKLISIVLYATPDAVGISEKNGAAGSEGVSSEESMAGTSAGVSSSARLCFFREICSESVRRSMMVLSLKVDWRRFWSLDVARSGFALR